RKQHGTRQRVLGVGNQGDGVTQRREAAGEDEVRAEARGHAAENVEVRRARQRIREHESSLPVAGGGKQRRLAVWTKIEKPAPRAANGLAGVVEDKSSESRGFGQVPGNAIDGESSRPHRVVAVVGFHNVLSGNGT